MANQPSDTILTLPNNITIRHYRINDIEPLSHHANNKNIWNALRNRIPSPYTIQDSENWIKSRLDKANWVASGPYTPSPNGAPGGTASGELLPTDYVIAIKDEPVGSFGFVFGEADEVYCRNAEIGYWLSEQHWQKGVMGIVVPAMVEWAWKTFGRLVRLEADVFEQNAGSQRCLEKAGLVVEGKKKFGFVKNGVFCTEVQMGMLRPGFDFEG